MAEKAAEGGTTINRIVTVLCFAVLGALTTHRMNGSAGFFLASAIGGAAVAWICLSILGWLLGAVNAQILRQHGRLGIHQALGKGFILMFPFTVLALLAELALGWNATQAFTSAGIMTAGAAVGAELIKSGGGKVSSWVLPSLGAVAFSAIWILLSALVRVAWR
jgi:hypothetical protein